MTKRILFSVSLITLLLLPGLQKAHAETAYVADSFEITLRTGPSGTHKVIKMLSSDEPLDVLAEEGNYLSVRTKEGDEGWVLKRFVSEDEPKSVQIKKLKERNEQLASLSGGAAGQIDALDKENNSLKQDLENVQKEFQQLKQKYAILESDAANVLNLKKEYADTEEKLQKVTADLERFTMENKELRASENLRWFLSGAGVVGIAWLIGYMMGRSRRKQQSSRLY